MNVLIFDSAEIIGQEVGKIFCDHVNNDPKACLGLATGMTPIPTFIYDG